MQTISFHIQMQDELPRAEDFGADAIPAATIRADSMTFRKERELHCAHYQGLACCDWKIRFDASPTASLQRQQCCLGSHSKQRRHCIDTWTAYMFNVSRKQATAIKQPQHTQEKTSGALRLLRLRIDANSPTTHAMATMHT